MWQGLKTACVVPFLLSLQLAIVGANRFELPASEPEKAERAAQLTQNEDALIRKGIYTDGLGTCIELDGPWKGRRTLVVPTKFAELHKKKRVAVLRLLLEIVKGGRPQDAVAACAYAKALEVDVRGATVYSDFPLDLFDEVQDGAEDTARQRFVVGVEKLLSAAEKQESGPAPTRDDDDAKSRAGQAPKSEPEAAAKDDVELLRGTFTDPKLSAGAPREIFSQEALNALARKWGIAAAPKVDFHMSFVLVDLTECEMPGRGPRSRFYFYQIKSVPLKVFEEFTLPRHWASEDTSAVPSRPSRRVKTPTPPG